ncbi:MAG: galactose-1-phosphate uridylyltransferase [Pseudomonadota bacterium]
MPELRKDPVVGRWVIISTERSQRPTDFKQETDSKKPNETPSRPCPFCFGNEHATPKEVLAYRKEGDANTPGWNLRVIPNKFPALGIEGELNRRGAGLYDMMNGIGAHEVIIETPDHNATLSTMPENQFQDVLWSYRDRIMDLKKDKRFRYVLIFKNHGYRAGASLEHPHSQLIALPIIPKAVMEEMQGSKEFYEYKERCLYCDIVQQELNDKRRIVMENDDFITICPFAPRFPFEMWILPKRHDAHFEDATKHEIQNLSDLFQKTLQKLDKALDQPAYNFMLHSSPIAMPDLPYYHWHIELTPRVTRVAGFERGSGFYICPTAPEAAAEYLRQL